MLKKINFLIFISILAFVSMSSISFARISCSSCYIGDCSCSVTECSSGTVYIYSTGDCSGSPDQSYTFSRNEFSWQPSSTKYYVIGLCDNGDTSDCTSVQVGTSTPTTTTTATTTTKNPCPINYNCCVSETSYENKLCKSGETCSKDHKCISTSEGGGSSIVLIVFLIVVLIAAGVAYFFIIKKRQPKGGYEELYAKWRR